MRTRKRTTTRGSYGQTAIENALRVVRLGLSLYKAAKEHGVPRKALRRHRDKKVQVPGLFGRSIDIPQELERLLADKIKEMERLLFDSNGRAQDRV